MTKIFKTHDLLRCKQHEAELSKTCLKMSSFATSNSLATVGYDVFYLTIIRCEARTISSQQG